MEPRMEDTREYRRREVRSWKKVFQPRGLAAEELAETSWAVADVEVWRQSEGVKKDDGVVG
jgi:hypothetical protein